MSSRTKKILTMCNTHPKTENSSDRKSQSSNSTSNNVTVEHLPPANEEDFEAILNNADIIFLESENVFTTNTDIDEFNSCEESLLPVTDMAQELVHVSETECEHQIEDGKEYETVYNNNFQLLNHNTEEYQANQGDIESDDMIEKEHNYSKEEDEDYQPETDEDENNEEDDNVTSEEEDVNETVDEQFVAGRGTKRKLHQKRRLLGKIYLGYRRPKNQKLTFQDTERNARVMGPKCSSQICQRSKKRLCNEISQEEREQIFKTFWENLTSWEQKKIYVSNLVDRKQTERKRTANETSRRSGSLFYRLNIGKRHVPVCKKMFLNTLGLKEWTVHNWLNNATFGTQEALNQTNHPRYKNEESIQFLRTFLDNLPKLPSHYCRNDTSKLYLEQTFTNFADLFKLYQEHCKTSGQPALSRNTLMKHIKSKNIGIFSPRKDQCDMCVQYQAGNLDQHVYEKHRNDKECAQKEKSKDKSRAELNECHVICMDLQAVKTCPSLQASSLYFKTKLCCHNYTVYDLKTKDVICYWFDETDTDLQASTFASLLVDFLKRKYLGNINEEKPIIIFSDGCTYQNRNATLANALLALSSQYNVTIIQKFLVKGHTNMECDSVHATIEKKLKNKTISIPNDYHRITMEARVNPKPYEVLCPTFEFFYNFNVDLVYESIRPGKKPTEPTVTDIRVLKYEKGNIEYKLNFDDNLYTPLPQRPKKPIKKIEDFPKLHAGKLPITQKKYQHLQEIKTKLHNNYWSFYDNLLHK